MFRWRQIIEAPFAEMLDELAKGEEPKIPTLDRNKVINDIAMHFEGYQFLKKTPRRCQSGGCSMGSLSF